MALTEVVLQPLAVGDTVQSSGALVLTDQEVKDILDLLAVSRAGSGFYSIGFDSANNQFYGTGKIAVT